MKGTRWYEAPVTMYLVTNGHVSQHQIHGETSRSWISGPESQPWNQLRFAKTGYTVTDEAAMEAYLWASKNRYRIGRKVEQSSPKLIRRVADLIGYKENP